MKDKNPVSCGRFVIWKVELHENLNLILRQIIIAKWKNSI